ncbi:CubicO group peptidase, beta-lactamase class C family [Chitinophaga jiangningensis]|uniref:CubicO group peptidase, beta-lactamase class C family n=1 Tax=Chitinophaga jiangningensis TaxID=1419482 RepID=A0A1M6ZZ62_9BACT|nr:serine hydrolase [Chitinophaga jiangningensis]SHL35781.1 CubicO group peptidase, beta-lactamase class C family [Chitinophaga jiangningensis]
MTLTKVLYVLLINCITTATMAQTNSADAFLRRKMQQLRIPGLQAAVVKDGKVVFLRSYGYANVEDSVRVQDRTVFSINSCTKAFTGVAAVQLVEKGLLDLNAPVSAYIDSLPVAWQPVTIRQLLTHVSGLPDILRVLTPGANLSEQRAWELVKAAPMSFKTGEQYSYNQTNYALLGKIIDQLRGMPFTEDFKAHQFVPAGMQRTLFGDSYDVIPTSAETYRYVDQLYGEPLPQEKLTRNFEDFPFFRRTASGLKSTAGDIAHWLIALQGGKLLADKKFKDTLWTAGKYNNGAPTQWALGWVTKPRPAHRAVTASGGGRAAFFIYPEDNMAVVVLTNLAGAYPEDFIDELAGYFNPAIPASDPITTLRMALDEKGYQHAFDIYQEKKKSNPLFTPNENDLNDWGYRLMATRQQKEALAIFKLVADLYPNSWNAYDSYGEALLRSGDKTAAIKMYQRSIDLNPDNGHGKKVLQQLQ